MKGGSSGYMGLDAEGCYGDVSVGSLGPVLVSGPSPSLGNTLSRWEVPVTRGPSQGFHMLATLANTKQIKSVFPFYFFNTHLKYKF